MTDELPACSYFAVDRHGYRVWKRILHHGGKHRAFDLIEPKMRLLSSKIRNRLHPAFANESLLPPIQRKRTLLTAFDEIRESRDLLCAQRIVDDLGVFIYGTTGVTLHVLVAGACLIQAMLATRNFELHLISCVSELAELEPKFVQHVGLTLRVRPT